ncbi:GntR family transcriptional regulator [Microbacterium sp. ASV49]|uniref:Winged helix-turn-helix domain-containing protein n=1 Tax=Microbacterium candidum TaxID=3041922 RepID=A0ABT7N1B3_9MICO|nr:winged helix-turn-helix domain-containing protein [Microbacterium sp. ASV49]MDL9980498.1 winged helix-turn-helix domain-containing protein [Microbacterium sp. ASV49]
MSSRVGPGAREAVFAQLADAGRAEQVARRITDGIVLGVLSPGERLPSEPELARRFGVALITVREGLGILRESGLVETRRGREGGSFVVHDDAEHHGILTARLRSLSQVEIGDVAVYFSAILAAAAERAAERAALGDAARLATWLGDADFDDAPAARTNQSGFFLELAVLSQSPRLVREQIRLQADAGPLLLLGLDEPDVRAAALAHDHRIVNAIAKRRPAPARAAAGSLIALLAERVLAAKARVERGGRLDEPLSA